jgi:hypothetical protein
MAGGAVADARTGKRFPLELPVRLHEPDSAEEHEALTADVSAAGVYIRAQAPGDGAKLTKAGERAWRRGARVEFEMTLPAAVVGAAHDVKVRCCGHVVRVEKVQQRAAGEKRNGVACVIDKYEFVRST